MFLTMETPLHKYTSLSGDSFEETAVVTLNSVFSLERKGTIPYV